MKLLRLLPIALLAVAGLSHAQSATNGVPITILATGTTQANIAIRIQSQTA